MANRASLIERSLVVNAHYQQRVLSASETMCSSNEKPQNKLSPGLPFAHRSSIRVNVVYDAFCILARVFVATWGGRISFVLLRS